MSMSTCVIYTSVSCRFAAKKRNSLLGQIETCRAFAKKHGLKVINVYSEYVDCENPRHHLLKALQEAKRKKSSLLISCDNLCKASMSEVQKKIFKSLQIDFSEWGAKIINLAN